MKLTERLLCIASKVQKGAVVADIGTDHAYIPVYLVKSDICDKAIAADINKGPLQRARKNISDNGLSQQIETRQGSGLKPINVDEVDTVIIAGMGGLLIRDILEQSKDVVDSIKTFILQPMIAQDSLREWLYSNNFIISDESLAREEDKIYNIIVAEHGIETADPIYFDIGKKLIEKNDPLLGEYLNKKINEQRKILNSIREEHSENAILKRSECETKINKYIQLLNSI